MEYQPPSDTHRGGGISFRALDAFLGEASRHECDPVNVSEWLTQARRAGRTLSSDRILSRAEYLLNDFPYQDFAQMLHPERGVYDMPAIRRHRRILLIARDAIILTTDTHTTNEFNELRLLCRTLGHFADTHGSQAHLADAMHNSILELSAGDRQARRYIHDDDALHAKFNKNLDAIGILKLHKPDERALDLHDKRKRFRRSVNTLALDTYETDDIVDRTVALNGLRINTAFGHVSDIARAADGRP